MKPKGRDVYIGIEIEFLSPFASRYIEDTFNSNKVLKSFCRLKYDGSIRADYSGRELTVLTKVSELKSKLLIVDSFLKSVQASVNKSCGLHVHLDVRNTNPVEVIDNIIDNIDDIEGSVLPERLKNRFCRSVKHRTPLIKKALTALHTKGKLTETVPFTVNGIQQYNWQGEISLCERPLRGLANFNRYRSVNVLSYDKFKTIEVRCHEGTVNVAEIYNWCKYLYEVAYGKQITKSHYIKQRIRTKGMYQAKRIA